MKIRSIISIITIMIQTFRKHLIKWLSCYSQDGVSLSSCSSTCTCRFDSAARALVPLEIPPPLSHSFSFACFPDTVSSASPRPRLALLFSSPHHSTPLPSLHPSSRSPACSSIQAPNRIRRDGRLEIHKLSIHHQRGGGWGGGRGCVHGGKTGGMEREKQSGIKKGEGKGNLRDRHKHKSPERGSKRLLRIWRQSNVGSDEGKRLRETFKELDVQVISADTCIESFTAGTSVLMVSKQGPGTKMD